MYENSFRLRGKTYDYKIQYDHIKKFMLLPKPDEMHTLITMGLDPPLRQGQTRYPFLVMQFKREEEVTIELNMTEYVFPFPAPLLSYSCSLANYSRTSTKTSSSPATKHPSTPWLPRSSEVLQGRKLSPPPKTLYPTISNPASNAASKPTKAICSALTNPSCSFPNPPPTSHSILSR